MSQAFIGRLRMFVPNVVADPFAEYYWGISEGVFGGCLWPCALRGVVFFVHWCHPRAQTQHNTTKFIKIEIWIHLIQNLDSIWGIGRIGGCACQSWV